MTTTRVKICCISSRDEAAAAIAHGAHALGLVSAMPSGPGPIDEDLIADIAARIPPGVDTFLLTCLSDAASIIHQLARTRCRTVQIVDAVDPATHEGIRRALPDVRIVQVIHVESESSIAQATELAPRVDALLLDSGRPSAAIKELGGTGRVHDWTLSRRIREAVTVPIYLAGGLRADNVADAIRAVRPFGVDLCSGVRTEGRLDRAKLAAFFAAVRAA